MRYKVTQVLPSLGPQKERNVEKQKLLEPELEEVPLEAGAKGIGMIRFLATIGLSKEITGNGIDGDDRIIWDKRFLDQIKEARKRFYDLLNKGFQAFMVKVDGKKSNRRMHKFNPNAEEIIMSPPVAGG